MCPPCERTTNNSRLDHCSIAPLMSSWLFVICFRCLMFLNFWRYTSCQGRPSPKSHDTTFPLPFLALPPLLPSLHSPFLPFLPLPPSLPFPPIPFPSLRSVLPLNPARGSGERCELPQQGLGEPQPQSNLVHFSLKIWHLVASVLNFVPLTSLFLYPRGFLWRILRRRGCLWTPMPAASC